MHLLICHRVQSRSATPCFADAPIIASAVKDQLSLLHNHMSAEIGQAGAEYEWEPAAVYFSDETFFSI